MKLSLVVLICWWPVAADRTGRRLSPVSGRVTYQGKPVPTGKIMFYPEQGRPATGAIDATATIG